MNEGPERVGARPGRALQAVLDVAEALASGTSDPILICGETGAGKDGLARRIHEAAGLSGPYVAVNMTAVPAELFESELMGTRAGAFTGAVARDGWIQLAEGGTIFLDEIGDLDVRVQAKLLRFLDDGLVAPVGSGRTVRPRVRVLAATNVDLDAASRNGTFRKDLLHRFGPPLRVPALRERPEDIEGIVAKELERAGPQAAIEPSALALLQRQQWPGNVRQLLLVLRRAIACGSRVTAEGLEPLLGPQAAATDADVPSNWAHFREHQRTVEATWLAAALRQHGGNVQAMARTVGAPPTTIRNLLLRHRLIVPEPAARARRA